VDRLGANFEDERVSLASAWKMQTMLLGTAVGSTIFKSDTDVEQAAYHPELKISPAHSQGVAGEVSTGFTLFRVEISS
jgi:hypothetical protein